MKTKIKKRCEKCGGNILIDDSVLLFSNPPKFKGTCILCNDEYFVTSFEEDKNVYYLIQGYSKQEDLKNKRHIYPTYVTHYNLSDEGSFGLQSGFTDALKFKNIRDAEKIKTKAELYYSDNVFYIVPFDEKIFGFITPRFIYNVNTYSDKDDKLIDCPECKDIENKKYCCNTCFGIKKIRKNI